VLSLYLFVPTTPPAGATQKMGQRGNAPAQGAPAMPQVEPASTDSIYAASLRALPEHAQEEVRQLNLKMLDMKDSAQMSPVFDSLAGLWKQHKQAPMAAWSTAKAAHLAHSEKKLNFAGQIFLELMHDAPNASMSAWEAQGAVACLEEALQINPNNDTTKLALAAAYIEGTGAPMSGVAILRDMVAKQPDHIPANLMLGRLSIQSGQFDKAVSRLEHVLKLDPKNREALYFLGEAYKGLGNKEKAVENFRKLEKLVNSPDFTKDIETYINSF
jgi:Flp pilus assembly protein TadD